MTEQEWSNCRKTKDLLEALPGTGHDRKYRLFACACARRLWELLDDERPRRAVEVAERYADGNADEEELSAACLSAKRFVKHQTQLAYASAGSAEAAASAEAAFNSAEPSYGQDAEFGAYNCAAAASTSATAAKSH